MKKRGALAASLLVASSLSGFETLAQPVTAVAAVETANTQAFSSLTQLVIYFRDSVGPVDTEFPVNLLRDVGIALAYGRAMSKSFHRARANIPADFPAELLARRLGRQ
jgi:hypothetical protein